MSNAAPSSGWIKLLRSEESLELVSSDPLAFALLAHIAMRARWHTGFNLHGLMVGEALIGDYAKMGLTRREYRTRLDRLVKWGFSTIRTTNKGTIATISNAKVFDVIGSGDGQPDGQQAANRRPLTKKEKTGKKVKQIPLHRLRLLRQRGFRLKSSRGSIRATRGRKNRWKPGRPSDGR